MTDFWSELRAELPRGVLGKAPQVSAAEWLTLEELAAPQWRYDRKTRPGQVLLGYARDASGKAINIGTADNRHILLAAGSRAGKGRSFLIPNLLLNGASSAIVLDPKGELAAITARRGAAMGQKVIIIDPFNASGAHDRADLKGFLGSYNPLDAIDVSSPRCIDDAAAMAAALVQVPPKGEPHWAEAAQIILTGVILYVCDTMKQEPGNRHFAFVDKLLSGNDVMVKTWGERNRVARAKALFDFFMRTGAQLGYGYVGRVGAQFAEMEERELSGVLSSVRTQCRFLASPELQKVMATSTFALGDLKRGAAKADGSRQPVTLYLCLPASMMGSHGRWLRLMIELAMVAFERTKYASSPPPPPTLFILEELCTTIGYSKQLESAAGLMAGYGIKLISVVQDLSQLQHHYEGSWETFIGNAGTLAFFGNSDATTLEYVSKKLGQTALQVARATGATPGAKLQGAADTAEELRVEPLLAASEVERVLAREKKRILILPAGGKPFILRRADYLEEDGPNPFAGMFDRHE